MPLTAPFAWLNVQSMAVFRGLAAPARVAGVAARRAPCAGPDMSAWLVQHAGHDGQLCLFDGAQITVK